MTETRLQAIERRLKRGWIYMQPADVEELLSLLKECKGVIEKSQAAIDYTLTEIRAWQGEEENEEGSPIKDLCDILKAAQQSARQTLAKLE